MMGRLQAELIVLTDRQRLSDRSAAAIVMIARQPSRTRRRAAISSNLPHLRATHRATLRTFEDWSYDRCRSAELDDCPETGQQF